MHLNRLIIEGFRSYREQQVIPLGEPGLVLLTGENRDRGKSSGSGKSTIFKALGCVLFEENDDDSTKDDGINKVYPEGGMSLGVDFLDDDGLLYYAQYSRKHPVSGTDWNFWRINAPSLDEANDDQFEDMRGAKLGDTKDAIEKVIGMNYTQFGNVAYIAQRRIAEFIASTDLNRRAVFTRVLGLTKIDKYIDAARAWKRELDGQVKENKGRIGVLAGQRDALSAQVLPAEGTTQLEQNLVDYRARLDEIEQRQAEIEENFEHMQNMTALRGQEQHLQEEVDRLAIQQRTLAAKPGGVPNAVTQIMEDGLAEIEAQVQDLTTRAATHRQDAARARAAARKIAATKSGLCEHCQQEVSAEHLRGVIAEYEQAIRVGESTASDLERQLQEARTELAERRKFLQQQRDDWNTWANLQTTLTETIRQHDKVKGQIDTLRKTLGDMIVDLPDQLAEERKTLQADHAKYTRAHAADEGLLIQNAERVNRLHLLIEQVKEAEALQDQRTEQLANIKVSEKLLERFKAWKISTSRTLFNNSMAKYLSLLTDGEITAELVTEKPLASGKGVKQEIDIIVTDGEKTGVPIKQYSGGEQAGLSLSITGAFWDLASSQTGSSVNLLLLDEPFNDMDAYGEEKACALLKHMRESGRTIMVVTNRQSVRERGTFDREIRAVKENHKTHLEFYDLRGEH